MLMNLVLGGSLNLQVRVRQESDSTALGTLTVENSTLSLCHQFRCFGYDLQSFSNALRELHLGSSASAVFGATDGATRLEVVEADLALGTLTISVDLESVRWDTDSDVDRIRLHGTALDRTYLVGWADQVDEFLQESGLDCRHPMEDRS